MTETQATRFRGKVAFVTGGSKGIGAGIVRRLASEDASVAFTYSHSEAAATQLVQELESKGSTALALKADSASAEELQNAVAKAADSLGRLDIFVSNAGILTRGTIDCFSIDDFDRMVAVNIRGAFIDLAPRAITVNNVQPGPTATDMSSPHAEMLKSLIPLKRMGDVVEVASFVCYLASEEAGFITGSNLTIDGGYVA